MANGGGLTDAELDALDSGSPEPAAPSGGLTDAELNALDAGAPAPRTSAGLSMDDLHNIVGAAQGKPMSWQKAAPGLTQAQNAQQMAEGIEKSEHDRRRAEQAASLGVRPEDLGEETALTPGQFQDAGTSQDFQKSLQQHGVAGTAFNTLATGVGKGFMSTRDFFGEGVAGALRGAGASSDHFQAWLNDSGVQKGSFTKASDAVDDWLQRESASNAQSMQEGQLSHSEGTAPISNMISAGVQGAFMLPLGVPAFVAAGTGGGYDKAIKGGANQGQALASAFIEGGTDALVGKFLPKPLQIENGVAYSLPELLQKQAGSAAFNAGLFTVGGNSSRMVYDQNARDAGLFSGYFDNLMFVGAMHGMSLFSHQNILGKIRSVEAGQETEVGPIGTATFVKGDPDKFDQHVADLKAWDKGQESQIQTGAAPPSSSPYDAIISVPENVTINTADIAKSGKNVLLVPSTPRPGGADIVASVQNGDGQFVRNANGKWYQRSDVEAPASLKGAFATLPRFTEVPKDVSAGLEGQLYNEWSKATAKPSTIGTAEPAAEPPAPSGLTGSPMGMGGGVGLASAPREPEVPQHEIEAAPGIGKPLPGVPSVRDMVSAAEQGDKGSMSTVEALAQSLVPGSKPEAALSIMRASMAGRLSPEVAKSYQTPEEPAAEPAKAPEEVQKPELPAMGSPVTWTDAKGQVRTGTVDGFIGGDGTVPVLEKNPGNFDVPVDRLAYVKPEELAPAKPAERRGGSERAQRIRELTGMRKAGTLTAEQGEELHDLNEADRNQAKVSSTGEEMPGVLNGQAYAQAHYEGNLKPAQVYLDADNFKKVNDTFGHGVGDDVIKKIGELLHKHLGDGNAFHFSGDEFGAQAQTPEEAHTAMQKVRDDLAQYEMRGFDVKTGEAKYQKGVGISYGVGTDRTEAEHDQFADKQRRKEAGLRFDRGEEPAEPGAGGGPVAQGGVPSDEGLAGEAGRAVAGREETVKETPNGEGKPAELAEGAPAGAPRAAAEGGQAGPVSEREAGTGAGVQAGAGEAPVQPAASGRAGTRRSVPARRPEPGEAAQPGGEAPAEPVGGQGSRVNYRATEHGLSTADLSKQSGKKAAARANIDALKLVKQLGEEGRMATPDEQKVLAKYVGWGGVDKAVDTWRATQASKPDSEKAPDQLKWEKDWLPLHQELADLLTPAEMDAARLSTLNAHYTSTEVISGIWKGIEHLGFTGGNALEPSAGIGNFIGLVPDQLAGPTRWMGVELDKTTAGILKQLYQDAEIHQAGFERVKLPKDSMDLVVSNFPFSDKIRLPYEGRKYPIHDYFFLKSLDAAKPGGLVVGITSHYTMDKADSSMRDQLAERADFLGAVRLPETAFAVNAGTEVVTDIIFLRKKGAGEALESPAFREIHPVEVETRKGNLAFPNVNEYFHQNPDMVLGTWGAGGLQTEDQLTVLPHEGKGSLQEQIEQAVTRMPEGVVKGSTEAKDIKAEVEPGRSVPDGAAAHEPGSIIRDGSLVAQDGTILQLQDGQLTKPDFLLKSKAKGAEGGYKEPTKDQVETVEKYTELKQVLTDLMAEEMRPDADEGTMDALRTQLNDLYDEVTKPRSWASRQAPRPTPFLESPAKGERHPLRWLRDDVDYPMIAAIEDSRGEGVAKGSIFRERVLRPKEEPLPGSLENIGQGVSASMVWRNGIDPEFIAHLTGMDVDRVREQLPVQRVAFIQPGVRTWEPASSYLSGNVRQKLAEAREAGPDYAENVAALEAVQPEPRTLDQVRFDMSSNWIPSKIMESGVREVAGVKMAVTYLPNTGAWAVTVPSYGAVADSAKFAQFSGPGFTAATIAEDCLKGRSSAVYDTYKGPDGKDTRVLNPEKTAAAQAAQQLMQEAFADWAPQHAEALETAYNDRMNHSVAPEWPVPSIVHYPDANQTVKLEKYQKRDMERALHENTLLAHAVGAGKTYTMITNAMEARRRGIAKKPMVVVQNATTIQFAAAARKLYPGKKVLALTADDITPGQRQRFLAQLKSSDFDLAVIPQSVFVMIPDSPERIQKEINRQSQLLEDEIRLLPASEKKAAQRSQKQAQAAIQKLKEAMLKQAQRATEGFKGWDDIGIDWLLVDESHAFKKLGFFTQRNRVKGIDSQRSQRAFSLYLKAQAIQELQGGALRGVNFATGTPVENTMAELWTIARFLRPDLNTAYRINSFDSFVGNFGQIVSSFEYTPTGQYKYTPRLAKFKNAVEFQTWFTQFAARVGKDQIERQVLPEFEGGQREIVPVDPSPLTEQIINDLSTRLKAWYDSSPAERKAKSAEPLVVEMMATNAAIDPRLVDPRHPSDPDSKLNTMIRDIYDAWQQGKADRTTSVSFLDRYRSPDPKSAEGEHLAGIPRFNAHHEIKRELIRMGVPEHEIFLFTDSSKKESDAAMDLANKGQIRVLVGTTQKGGTGVNMQDRLRYLSHGDTPARPSDMEQREGRAIRAGNTNTHVGVKVYGTKRSLDTLKSQRVFTKMGFINQFLYGKLALTDHEFADVGSEDQLSYNDMVGAFSGDPRIIRKAELEREIQALEAQRAGFYSSQRNAKKQVQDYEQTAPRMERILHEMEKDAVREQGLESIVRLPETLDGYKAMTEEAQAFGPAVQAAIGSVQKLRQVYGVEPSVTVTGTFLWEKSLPAAPAELGDGYTLRGNINFFTETSFDGALPQGVRPVSSRLQYQVYDANGAEVLDEETGHMAGGLLRNAIQAVLAKHSTQLEQQRSSIERNARSVEVYRQKLNQKWNGENNLDALRGELSDLKDALEKDGVQAKDGDQIPQGVTEDADETVTREAGDEEEDWEPEAAENPVTIRDAATIVARNILNDPNDPFRGQRGALDLDGLRELILQGAGLVRQQYGNLEDWMKEMKQRLGDAFDAVIRAGRPLVERIFGESKKLAAEHPDDADKIAPVRMDFDKDKRGLIAKIGEAAADIKGIFDPANRTPLAADIAMEIRRLGAKRALENVRQFERLKKINEVARDLGKDWNYSLIDDIENGRQVQDPRFRPVAEYITTLNDLEWAEANRLGMIDSYIENYFPHLFEDNKNAADINKVLAKRALEGSKGFTKKRTFATLADAIEAGYTPKEGTFIDWFLASSAERKHAIIGRQIWDYAKNQGALRFVKQGEQIPQGMSPINDKIARVVFPTNKGMVQAGQWVAFDAVADVMNNHLSQGLEATKLKNLYAVANNLNNLANMVQLGMSAYHIMLVSTSAQAMSVQLGMKRMVTPGQFGAGLKDFLEGFLPVYSQVKDYRYGLKMKAELMKDVPTPGIQPMVDAYLRGGAAPGLPQEYASNFRNGLRDAIGEHQYLKVAWKLPFALVEHMGAPLMEHYVPIMQIAATMRMAEFELKRLGPDADPKDVSKAMTEAYNSVQDLHGQLRYDNLFWHKITKQALQLSLRAAGFTIGTERALIGGSLDIAKFAKEGTKAAAGKLGIGPGGDPKFTYRMAALIGLALVTSVMNGILNYLINGNLDGPLDLVSIRSGGKDTHGKEKRYMFASYMKEVIHHSEIVKDMFHGDFGSLEDMVTGKASPLGGSIMDILANRHWSGGQPNVQIFGTGESAFKHMEELAVYALEQFRPIGLAQYMDTVGSQGSKKAAMQSVGVFPLRSSENMTPAERLAARIMHEHAPSAVTAEAAAAKAEKKSLTESVINGEKVNPADYSAKDLKQANKSAARAESGVSSGLGGMLHDASWNEAMEVWARADASERANPQYFKVMNEKYRAAVKAAKPRDIPALNEQFRGLLKDFNEARVQSGKAR